MTQQNGQQGEGRWREDGTYDWGDGASSGVAGDGAWGSPAEASDPWAQARRENEVYAQRQGGGGLFPFPHRTWQTKRGTSVTVGGCCLPLPIGCLASTMVAAAALARVAVEARRG